MYIISFSQTFINLLRIESFLKENYQNGVQYGGLQNFSFEKHGRSALVQAYSKYSMIEIHCFILVNIIAYGINFKNIEKGLKKYKMTDTWN